MTVPLKKFNLTKTGPVHLNFRNWIQIGLLSVTVSIGIRFYLYVQQVFTSIEPSLTRPSGVEAFLPIGALLAWKKLLLTGEWDTIHPAAMVIFGFALGISFLFRKSFCSWICPVGTLSEGLWRLGNRLFRRTFRLPIWLDRLLRSVKYLLLLFFLWVVGKMSVMEITLFLESPYYKISDVKMLRFFTQISITTAVVLIILTIGSIVIKNFWCRYFCPYGALTGLIGILSPTRIKRSHQSCIDCQRCSEICPHGIEVHKKTTIVSPECSGCMDCTKVCPVKQTLVFESYFTGISKTWTQRQIGIILVVILVGVIVFAMINGVWESQLPTPEFRNLLQLIESPYLTHP